MKKCNRHGVLTEDQIRTYVRNRRGQRKTVIGCKICHRETASRSRNSDRTRENERVRKDRKENPEKYREWAKNLRNKDREKYRLREVLRIHGLTKEVYDKMMLIQDGLCKICGEPEKRVSRCGNRVTRLSIDHCHRSLKIRGLLCHDCNTGLGKFRDLSSLLRKAALYLDEHEEDKVA